MNTGTLYEYRDLIIGRNKVLEKQMRQMSGSATGEGGWGRLQKEGDICPVFEGGVQVYQVDFEGSAREHRVDLSSICYICVDLRRWR